ncbi:hypothetical protein [Williamsia herbipolensis]|uniref:hypothetical protein n=1 Tax=Williamsia herbipolensis TaxID=1603258 RepID=UPI0005F80EE4|nr:hypothetical protein [Williamsia herbipolensis]
MARSSRSARRQARHELSAARRDLDRLLGTGDPHARTPRWFLAAGVLVVSLVIATFVVLVVRGTQTVYRDTDFTTAAQTTVSALLLPDARDPDRARQILDASTGSFRDEFAQSTGAYRTLVTRLGTVATGSVDGVALAGRDGDTAEVLVTAVVLTRSGTGESTPGEADTATAPNRFRLMVRIEPDSSTPNAGELKLSRVEFLP